MKKILSVPLALFLLLALALGCRAATPSFQDFATEQFSTLTNKVRIKSGVFVSVSGSTTTSNGWTIFASDLQTLMQIANGQVVIAATNFFVSNDGGNTAHIVIANGLISGNAPGLTNINFSGITNWPAALSNLVALLSNNYVGMFTGQGRAISNINAQSLFWPTNAAGSGAINATNTLQFLSTNNNVVFSGYANLSTTGGHPVTVIITNTAGPAAVKFIQFPAGTLMLSAPFTNVVYNTNQGVFSLLPYQGGGTNATWTGF